MSDTDFTDSSPEKGNRVEIKHLPDSYVVKTWVDGRLVDERPLDTLDQALEYHNIQARRYL